MTDAADENRDTSAAGGDKAPKRGDTQRERQDGIRQRVVNDGFVRAEALATEFDVSVMTIHRDLDALQAQGWLRKVRGGATAQPSAVFHGDVAHRMSAMSEVKHRLARAALDLVAPGQTVMLDESTTCLHVAQLLAERTPLTVITHFLPAIKLLAGEPGINLIALGGTYLPAYDAFLGLHTAESAGSFRADLLLMSTTAITGTRCYHQSQDTVQVKRAMMEHAARRILLVDHTKFSREGLFALAPLNAFDLVITDEQTKPDVRRHIRDLGVPVQIV